MILNKIDIFTSLTIINDILRQLKPLCNKIEISGSLRRNNNEQECLDLICIPKTQVESIQNSLFFSSSPIHKPITLFTKTVHSLGKVLYGNTYNNLIQIYLPEKIILNLFIPLPNDYFRILALTTGPENYSKNVIRESWIKKGWVESNKGLKKLKDCNFENEKFFCYDNNTESPPPWVSEREFFQWLDLEYIDPSNRL